MAQPLRFVDLAFPSHVCCLQRAIYGLKQAHRAWYNELRQFLVQNGFVNSLSDTSLFIFNANGCVMFLFVYVDDIIVTGSDGNLVDKFISSLARRFSIKDLGALSYFLGVEVLPCSAGLFLTQQKYVTELLHRTKIGGSKPASTPLPTDHDLKLLDGTSLTDATEYRQVIGALQYLSFTRPDIAFAVNKLAQFMHRLTTGHWSLTKHLMCYLQVARSSTEAEYMMVATTASEMVWLTSLLCEMMIPAAGPPTTYCDNISATYLCSNPIFHSRMKHIAIGFHFVREKVQSNQLCISHVSSADQLANSLTKPLSRTKFFLLRFKISVSEMPTVLRGRVKDVV
ncbi:hypothetical protein LWI28_007044 [Acer negundo]|uniref:Reverse transcriptase Ty1/copia-type domain-containing protein n=1 Tax=Acer negundo TaxID=4023 RepID=A0AAD5NJ06_ACENE|nr:hypothetical protein LWI28_007044 [Acer negundo]